MPPVHGSITIVLAIDTAKLSLEEFVTWLIRTNAATSIDFITVLCKSRVVGAWIMLARMSDSNTAHGLPFLYHRYGAIRGYLQAHCMGSCLQHLILVAPR